MTTVGPAAPCFSSVDRCLRYPIKFLSSPHAEYSTLSARSEFVLAHLRDNDRALLREELKCVSAPLSGQTKRAPGGQTGFFEQGISVGLGMFGFQVLLGVGAVGYFGVRTALKWRS